MTLPDRLHGLNPLIWTPESIREATQPQPIHKGATVSTTKGEYTAMFVPPIAAVIPPSAFIEESGQVQWSARWTTPAGVWMLDYRNRINDYPTVAISGRRIELKLEWPKPDIVIGILREAGAIDSPPSTPETQEAKATPDQWRQAYDAKVAEFAAETRKTSVLIQALQAMSHRSHWAHHDCPGCVALSEVNAIDPAPEVRCDPA